MEERRRNEDTRIEVLTERVENWMQSTTEYRLSLCAKLDKINDRLDKLPCEARIEASKGIKFQLNLFWWAIGLLIPMVLGLSVAWGSMQKQLEINTGRWDRYLQEKINGEQR